MVEIKLFDDWNIVKKSLQQKDKVDFFKERQIWWCSIGQNLGSESYGKGMTFTRPVLVFRKLSSDIFLGLPLTSKIKQGSWYMVIRHQAKDVTVLYHQARILDKKRLVGSLGEVDDADFAKIKTGFVNLYCA
jgi:mRNA interferase MazF